MIGEISLDTPSPSPSNTNVDYMRIYGHRSGDLPLTQALQHLNRKDQNPLHLIDKPEVVIQAIGDAQIAKEPDTETIKFSRESLITPERRLHDDLSAIEGRLVKLEEIDDANDVNGLDREHFQIYTDRIRFLIRNIKTIKDPLSVKELQNELKSCMVNATYAKTIKKIPRFYINSSDDLVVDRESMRWSPGYFIMGNSLPVLKSWLKGQDIIDPFAGPGSFMNFLAANEIPKSIVYGDICYADRKNRNRTLSGEFRYAPEINAIMHAFMFEGLPLWCQPDIAGHIKQMTYFDATEIPFDNDSFDLVVSDPPYGVNLDDGGLEFFIETLPELLAVSRRGGIFLIPVHWFSDLKRQIPSVQELTGDLSNGFSKKLPTQFVHVPKYPR